MGQWILTLVSSRSRSKVVESGPWRLQVQTALLTSVAESGGGEPGGSSGDGRKGLLSVGVR